MKAWCTWEVLGSDPRSRKVRSSGLRDDSSSGAGPLKKAFSRGRLSMCCTVAKKS